MVAMPLLTAFAVMLFVYIFMPSVWMSIMAVDDALDAHESGKAVVASRNPFRETGPPACMAKLIMLRHKMDQSNARKHRRGSNQARQVSRPYNFTSARPRWMRFGKPFGKQYH